MDEEYTIDTDINEDTNDQMTFDEILDMVASDDYVPIHNPEMERPLEDMLDSEPEFEKLAEEIWPPKEEEPPQEPAIDPMAALLGSIGNNNQVPVGGNPDYMPLLKTYNQLIETIDNNVSFVKQRTDIANKRCWIAIGIAVVALILAIIK